MSSKPENRNPEGEMTRERLLHCAISPISPLPIAAMQVLVYAMEAGAEGDGEVTAAEFAQAVEKVQIGARALQSLVPEYLTPHDITLPEALTERLEQVMKSVDELMRMTARCTGSPDEARKFQPVDPIYDLCCTRVAKGVRAFIDELSAFFLQLNDKGRADASDHTSAIAMEIGKIGRVINMVATNASIEAARVGDAGKGFTVIADEVKTLSSRVSSLSVSLTDNQNPN